uniref:Large ribosomal subunit protein uL18c n=1 Tax=Glycine max TaxID=3847 RepID=C6SYV3_SOYBN|nr:unknown [Glycine max]
MLASSLSFLHSCSSSSFLLSISLPNPKPSHSLPFVLEAKDRTRREDRSARHTRIRKKVEGTPERPRLSVFRSNKHLSVQVIDDTKMHTLASISTMQKTVAEEFNYSAGPTLEVAKRMGEIIAKSCLEKGITKVAFDQGGYPYHGRVQALAEAAREHGLDF